MARAGYFPLSELQTLRQFGTRLQGHPEREKLPGVENTSGPLGSGLAQAAGVACLVPFHFSRRYEDYPLQVYNEVRLSCGQAVLPKSTDFIPG